MHEIIRIVDALQTTDANGVATPANWKPGTSSRSATQYPGRSRRESKHPGYECVDCTLQEAIIENN